MKLETFLLEDRPERIYALYAALMDYSEKKKKQTPKGQISIAGAEAYCMVQELKDMFPEQIAQCEIEYLATNQ